MNRNDNKINRYQVEPYKLLTLLFPYDIVIVAMSLFLSAWQIALRRSLANWRLLSTVVAGAVVAVALLSSAPLYSNAINDLGLKHALRTKRTELLDLDIYAPNYFVTRQEYDTAQGIVDQLISQNIKSIIRQQERWLKSQTFYAYYTDRPTPGGSDQPTGHFHVFTNLEKHIKVLEGHYAEPAPYSPTREELEDPGFYIEGMIGSETAKNFGIGVGDRLVFIGGYGEYANEVTIEITAIIEPIDPSEEFWFLNTDIFAVPLDQGRVAPIFIPEQSLFEAVGQMFPGMTASYHWFYYVDIDKVNSQNAETIKNAIRRMERQLLSSLPRSGLFTVLASVITEYQGKLMYTQIPLFLIVSQIVAIILYYLITVANMLIERESGEIALFRSRGASTWHIIGIYFMEGVLISAIGAAVGPFLGAFVFSLLGKTGAFRTLTGGGLLPIRFSGTVLVLAITAAVLCLLALLVPAIQAARRGVVHHRQQAARPPSAPLWQRFYLDLVALVFGGVLYWELRERGTLLTIKMFGEMGVDPLLLVTPMLFMLAVAIVFLRLFPIIISLATRLSRYVGNAPVVLGLWYMARNPVHYGRLILLLIMAASVGMFSATFLGTLERNYNERTLYSSGGDVRLEQLNDQSASKDTLYERYSSVPGVERVNIAYRSNGTVGTMFTQTELTLLAVEPQNLSQIAWYRDDFADKPLPELMNLLTKDTPIKEGLELPDGTEALGIWVYPEEGNLKVEVHAKVKDGLGHYVDRLIGTTQAEGWQYLEAKLTAPGTDAPLPSPVTLVCLYVRPIGMTGLFGSRQGVYFDDLQVRGSFSSEPVVIEDFEDVSEWTVSPEEASASFSGAPAATDTFAKNMLVVHSGNTSARFGWAARGVTSRTVYPNLDSRPLVVIASRSLLDSAKISVGRLVQVRLPGQFILVSIEDVVDYFPTLDPAQKGFLIANLDRLISIRNRQLAAPIYPNEVWLKVTGDKEQRQATLNVLGAGRYGAHTLYDREAMISQLRTDPLAAAGWGGMLMIAFLGVVLISSLGFVVYSYLSAQARQLDFAILRTLGFSLRQIIGLVCFEQIFIIVAGLGIGTLIGERLSYVMMPFLQLTEQGQRVVPSFILTINWGTIGIAYAILAMAFIITISLVILFFSRVAIHRTLRMGEA